MEDGRTDNEEAASLCFQEGLRRGVDGDRVFFRCAIRFWVREVSGGTKPAGSPALASQPRDFGLMRDSEF